MSKCVDDSIISDIRISLIILYKDHLYITLIINILKIKIYVLKCVYSKKGYEYENVRNCGGGENICKVGVV